MLAVVRVRTAHFQLGEATDQAADNRPSPSATTIERMPVPPAVTPEPTIVVTVADAAVLWLARGRGMTGPWARSTRERYDRTVRQHIERSVDGTTVPIGTVPLADLTVDAVAGWSAAKPICVVNPGPDCLAPAVRPGQHQGHQDGRSPSERCGCPDHGHPPSRVGRARSS